MKKNDIITVMTLAGEFVGKFEGDDNGLELSDPRTVVQGPEGQMGFARGICQTGVENPKEIAFNDFMFITPCNEEVENAYRQATSGLVMPDKKLMSQ